MKVSTYRQLKSSAENVVVGLKSGTADNFRVTTKVWKFILINKMDKIFVDSNLRKIVAKNLGVGVYELSLEGD